MHDSAGGIHGVIVAMARARVCCTIQAWQLSEDNHSTTTVSRKERCLQHWETWTRTPQTEGAALTTTQVDLCERAALEQHFAKLHILQLLAQHGSAQQTATRSSKQLMLTQSCYAA